VPCNVFFVRAVIYLLCFTIKHFPRLPCVLFWWSRSLLPHIYCNYFLLAPTMLVFTALPFFDTLFFISLFQASQNAHQDWPSRCSPVLPEEICGRFLSTQQVSWDFRVSQLVPCHRSSTEWCGH